MKILFVGDSITHGTNWSSKIDFAEVLNIAVPGYSTEDVKSQLKEIQVLNPDLISLLIGTNDFGNLELDRTGEETGSRVVEIIDSILSHLPDAKLIVNSILPRGVQFTHKIAIANELISRYKDIRVTYLDCWNVLAKDNYLNPDYLLDDGFDGHLNENGYEAWSRLLIPAIKKYL